MGWFNVRVNKIEQKHIYRRIANKIKREEVNRYKEGGETKRVIWY